MHQRIVQQTFMVLYFLLSNNEVQGEIKLSKLEDSELERQLKLLNKPAVKIVKTKYGDTYDCVDYYKQPAFDHPLLKDHDFHPKMRPTFSRIKQNSGASTVNTLSNIWLNDEGCPFGTVPIKRITKDDLIRRKQIPPPEDDVAMDSQLVSANNNSESKGRYISSQGYKVAIARTWSNPNSKFAGAGMRANVYNPHVEGQQHSACRLKVQKGSDILQVGWRVDPTLYGDSQSRLFIHFQAGTIRCFNTLCPGFIIVNTEIPLDLSLQDSLSKRGQEVCPELVTYIQQDLANGNWWLLLEGEHKQIGFWPKKIFTSLASFATDVEWGGVVYSPPGVPEPPMGSSFFPIEDTAYDAYCRGMKVSNEEGKYVDVDNAITYTNNPNNYKVFFKRLWYGKESEYFVGYGGPGEKGQV